MFFQVRLLREALVQPWQLKADGSHRATAAEMVVSDLAKQVWIDDRDCYFVARTGEPQHASKGCVMPRTGAVSFTFAITCIVFKLFPGEVIDLVVDAVIKLGVEGTCGPCSNIFVPSKYLPGFEFVRQSKSFRSKGTEQVEIRRGSSIRVRLIDVKATDGALLAVATMEGKFLRPLESGECSEG